MRKKLRKNDVVKTLKVGKSVVLDTCSCCGIWIDTPDGVDDISFRWQIEADSDGNLELTAIRKYT